MRSLILLLLIFSLLSGCSSLKKKKARIRQAFAAAVQRQSTLTGIGPFVLHRTDVSYMQVLKDSLEPGTTIPYLHRLTKQLLEEPLPEPAPLEVDDFLQLSAIWVVPDSTSSSDSILVEDSWSREDSIGVFDSLAMGVDSFSITPAEPLINYSENLAELVEKHPAFSENLVDSSTCSDSREFYVKEVTIDGIKVENLHLQFYKGKLYSLQCKANEELRTYLQKKFGNPASSSKEREVPLKDGSMGKLVHTDMYWYNKTYNGHLTWSMLNGEEEEGAFQLLDNAFIEEWEACYNKKATQNTADTKW